MAASDAKFIPIKNQAYRLTFDSYTIVDQVASANTNGTGMDTKISKDGGAFADATNEAIEIAPASGIYYIDLTATEMNADTVIVKTFFSNLGAFPYPVFLYPQEAGDIITNVVQIGGTPQTGRDIGASVLLSPGTGTGQVNLSSGAVPVTGDLTATMKTSVTTAATAATPTPAALSTQAKTDVQAAMTSQGYTATRAAYLDTLNNLVAAVWANVTRTLTAGTNIVLAKGAGITGFNDLSAAQVNAEADTALADAGVTTTVTGRIDVATSTRSTLTAANVWQYVIEGTKTAEQFMRIIFAVLAGKVTGANTTNPKFRDIADTKNRVDVETDGSGNRTSITTDGT